MVAGWCSRISGHKAGWWVQVQPVRMDRQPLGQRQKSGQNEHVVGFCAHLPGLISMRPKKDQHGGPVLSMNSLHPFRRHSPVTHTSRGKCSVSLELQAGLGAGYACGPTRVELGNSPCSPPWSGSSPALRTSHPVLGLLSRNLGNQLKR